MEQRVTTYSQYAISANVNDIKNIEAQTLNGLSIQKIYFTVAAVGFNWRLPSRRARRIAAYWLSWPTRPSRHVHTRYSDGGSILIANEVKRFAGGRDSPLSFLQRP
jgi:hypothetical protein